MAEVEAQAVPGGRQDPFRNYNFTVVIDGQTEARFSAVSGFGMEMTPTKYREGGDLGGVRMIAGQVDMSPVTLSWGETSSEYMWEWMLACSRGEVQRRDVNIVIFDPTGTQEVARYLLEQAFPVGFVASEMNAVGTSVAIASMTLVYEGLNREVTRG